MTVVLFTYLYILYSYLFHLYFIFLFHFSTWSGRGPSLHVIPRLPSFPPTSRLSAIKIKAKSTFIIYKQINLMSLVTEKSFHGSIFSINLT